ncbi:MAG: hypothetical protein K8I04_03800 [Gammaproteobacteria bacterium]|nr:hypothetical protein [Gammaproteobacteria bacterium]
MPRTIRHTPNKTDVDLPTPSAALSPQMNLWILRALIPLRGCLNWLEEDGFYVSTGCLTAVLGFSECEDYGAKRFNRRAVVQEIRRLFAQAEKRAATARLSKALTPKCAYIATPNRMDRIDPVALRHFDIKLRFGYLRPRQAWRLLRSYWAVLGLRVPASKLKPDLATLTTLSPGDFAAVARHTHFNRLPTTPLSSMH